MASLPQTPAKGAWRMVAVGSIAQNFSVGLGISSFGVAMLAIEQEFHTSRTLAAAGASLMLLVSGVCAPLATRMMELLSIRTTMIIGVLIGSVGYAALAMAPNISFFLVAYAVLVGGGFLLGGALPASILVSNWFPTNNGRAIGVMMIPLGAMLVPLACMPILENLGLRALYWIIAAVNLLLLPLLLLVRESPPAPDAPTGREDAGTESADAGPRMMGPIEGLCRPEFWLVITAISILDGSGMIKVSHLVALAAERGVALSEATLLLSVSGAAGAVGSLFFGWLADRIGGAAALLVNGLIHAATWAIFFLEPGMPLLTVDAMAMGVAGAGAYSAMIVALTNLFGTRNLTRTLGLASIFGTLPTILAPPIAGMLHDAFGSYTLLLHLVILACLSAAGMMAVLMMRYPSSRSRRVSPLADRATT